LLHSSINAESEEKRGQTNVNRGVGLLKHAIDNDGEW